VLGLLLVVMVMICQAPSDTLTVSRLLLLPVLLLLLPLK
jgi:hypothetical protein